MVSVRCYGESVTGLWLRGEVRNAEEHFVGGFESEVFVKGGAFAGGMEGNDADVEAAGLIDAEFDQETTQAATAVCGIDEDVEEIGAGFAGGIEGMRRPVEEQHAGGGSGILMVGRDPAEVFAGFDHAPGPRLGGAAQSIEEGFVEAAHGGEHGAPVGGDEGGIVGRGGAGFEHGGSIEGGARRAGTLVAV